MATTTVEPAPTTMRSLEVSVSIRASATPYGHQPL
eukprot:CAMPEP_0196803958 /NCGR_PEP_ID=MMETSP1362-20130617/3465_1 /TAXON_ID=163516 /ORGANISM="Leptocylindrus danicus, Strain CCMP1856" /LENGTH=34 /DNA_ID= /DNA_START= /DNA_END= /DNA_ORIENTATION=